MSLAYGYIEEFDLAIKALEQVIHLEKNVNTYLQLRTLYRYRGMMEKEVRLCRSMLNSDFKNIVSRDLATLFHEELLLEEALNYYKEAYKSHKETKSCLYHLNEFDASNKKKHTKLIVKELDRINTAHNYKDILISTGWEIDKAFFFNGVRYANGLIVAKKLSK